MQRKEEENGKKPAQLLLLFMTVALRTLHTEIAEFYTTLDKI